ncbi:MAG TPA: hypothetical protein VJ890_01450 [Vineibacter sp.]|nr:hypothetical protein [Vineibacter sp.]
MNRIRFLALALVIAASGILGFNAINGGFGFNPSGRGGSVNSTPAPAKTAASTKTTAIAPGRSSAPAPATMAANVKSTAITAASGGINSDQNPIRNGSSGSVVPVAFSPSSLNGVTAATSSIGAGGTRAVATGADRVPSRPAPVLAPSRRAIAACSHIGDPLRRGECVEAKDRQWGSAPATWTSTAQGQAPVIIRAGSMSGTGSRGRR